MHKKPLIYICLLFFLTSCRSGPITQHEWNIIRTQALAEAGIDGDGLSPLGKVKAYMRATGVSFAHAASALGMSYNPRTQEVHEMGGYNTPTGMRPGQIGSPYR